MSSKQTYQKKKKKGKLRHETEGKKKKTHYTCKVCVMRLVLQIRF